jgi:predicted nuclease of predicted toxin-antitoxin system
MRFLADENFPGAAIAALRQQEHDVLSIRTDAPGSSDNTVLERAQAEERILLTFDRDFGELAFRAGLPATSGIVLFRVRLSSAARITQIVVTALAMRTDWAGQFSVVEDDRIRMRPIPGIE